MIQCPPSLKRYRGNKGFEQCYIPIINEIPPHTIFAETCVGSGGVYRHKKPAEFNFLNDIDQAVMDAWENEKIPGLQLYNQDIVTFIKNLDKTYYGGTNKIFLYIDPPYLLDSRPNSPNLYKHEMDEDGHVKYLQAIANSLNTVMISHYPHPIYDKYLEGWRTRDFQVSYNGNVKTERLYMNYTQPTALHQYDFLGTDWIDRQRIRRKIKRRINTLSALPILERSAIMEGLQVLKES